MIYHIYVPQSPLSQFVRFLWSSEGDNLTSSRVRLLPIGSMELVINLCSKTIPLFDRNSRELCGSTSGNRLCGIHSQSFIIDNNSQICVMGVRFKPGGSVPFFQFPASELHNQVMSLDELWDYRAGELQENLLKAPKNETRFLLLERFLLNMIVKPPEQNPVVDLALREFQKSPTLTVNDVTNQIGISNRHFGQLFSDTVGLTPKLFCRIQRLRRVLHLLATKKNVDWADIAFTCDYFDQAHFIHDFRAFTGCTPTDYLKQKGLHPCHVVLPD